MVGVAAKGLLHTTQPYQYAFYHDERRFICGGGEAYSLTYFLQAGITIGIALDLDDGTIEFFHNGVSDGVVIYKLS